MDTRKTVWLTGDEIEEKVIEEVAKILAGVEGPDQRLVVESRSDGATGSPLTSSSAAAIAETRRGLDAMPRQFVSPPPTQSEAEECRPSGSHGTWWCGRERWNQKGPCYACPARGKRSGLRNGAAQPPEETP